MVSESTGSHGVYMEWFSAFVEGPLSNAYMAVGKYVWSFINLSYLIKIIGEAKLIILMFILQLFYLELVQSF